jgi:Protein of unknown function (DUF3108)
VRRWLWPLLAYLTAAVVATWPLLLHPRALLGAPSGAGDPYLNLWILGWGMQAILSNPASVFTGAVFDANIFYPATGTLAYSDHLLLQSFLLAPLYAITHDVVLCYNVLLIASLVASALAMHLLVRSVVCTESGAYLAGLAWGFGSYHFAHLIHLQLQSLYFLPLTFLFLHRLVAGRRVRDVVLLGIVTALQAVSSVYYGVIGGLALVVGAVALAGGVGRWRSTALLRRLYYAASIAVVLVLPVAIVYGRVAQREGFGRNLYEAGRGAAYASSYLQAPPGNVLYGRTGLLRQHDTPVEALPAEAEGATAGPPHTGPERELFPGFVLIGLAVAGAWLGWRSDAQPTVMAMLAVAALGFVLSLGPDGIRPLYAALHRFVFGFGVIRAPARFSVLVMFGLCVLAAVAIRELSQPRRPAKTRHGGTEWLRVSVARVVVAAALIELWHLPMSFASAPSLHTDVGQWLAREPGTGAVAILPLGLDIDSTPAMVQSLEHHRPIVNGYSGQRPAFYRPLVEAIDTFPSAAALAALHDSRVRFVVTSAPVTPIAPFAPVTPFVERARFPGATIYELRWTPELETRLAATTTIEPPAPGPIPFHAGELARYRVDWGGAGVNLSAGDISIGVELPAYRLVVNAATAPWVAKFFEARDLFATQADASLIPQIHERDQQEGSRHVTRAFVFDDRTHVVRTGRTVAEANAEGAVVLPMAPGARDAIAALFYVRTLPLKDGQRVRFPVNEAGRNVVVELSVDGIERVHVQGKDLDAIRVTPTLKRRVEDRRPLVSTIWLSNDQRRIPLVLELDAGFGHVRVELVSYSQ